ncbi:MAG TPA: hypothetical protein VEG32_05410, partial [Clostridia bacterium]|nr:hypothetical protein [Clostridia bacterium]
MATPSAYETENIRVLSLLTLDPARSGEALAHVERLDDAGREALVTLSDSHHVVLRALHPLRVAAAHAGDSAIVRWCDGKIARENARIANALVHLEKVTAALEAAGCPTTVMKSLDHWPDIGNDLDLFTTASEQTVSRVMTQAFNAHIEPRSWGDRLANKWNFAVPGLPEAVEMHAKRLGQTGEHIRMAQRFVSRRQQKSFGGCTFHVPAPEERIIVATLQRMYRHFYFRVCDIVNTMTLVESGVVDFAELKKAADLGGIWKGVCSFLKIVSDYVEQYRGRGIPLPPSVLTAAPFGGDKVYVRAKFIRVPIVPQGAELYTDQVLQASLRGDVPATFRLSL